MFVMVPVVAVTVIGIVISGKLAHDAIAAVTVQVMVDHTSLQFHGDPVIAPFLPTHAGRVSVTVVCPDTEAGPLLVTRMM